MDGDVPVMYMGMYIQGEKVLVITKIHQNIFSLGMLVVFANYVVTMGASQCGNERPGFGVVAVTEETAII